MFRVKSWGSYFLTVINFINNYGSGRGPHNDSKTSVCVCV